MEFRLIYRGPLPAQGASSNRTREKHQLRKQFQRQLRELFRQHPDLREQSEWRYLFETAASGEKFQRNARVDEEGGKTHLEHVADEYQRLGGRFLPFVRKRNGFTCSLDILFLRRDNPGNLISSGGDIDNRIKVLFDALKMPSIVADLGGFQLDHDENPFYCLLEDDSLITQVSITTDRLLLPMEQDERMHDVHLVIHVTVNNPHALFGALSSL
jgi:hypothetical protein